MDSEVNTAGTLIIKKIKSEKIKFTLEWRFIPEAKVRMIMNLFRGFNCAVVYIDLFSGSEKTGYFYPGDFQPAPNIGAGNIYDTFALNIVEK